MDVVSIHSHKGGAGKTTLALILAKANGLAGKKVCTIDLDFVGAGLGMLLDIPLEPKKFLDEYVTRSSTAEHLPTLDELTVTYTNDDYTGDNLKFMLNLGGHPSLLESDERRNSHLDAIALAAREPYQKHICRAVKTLLEKLNECKFNIVILDCQPGISYLSHSIITMSKENFIENHISIHMATTNLAHYFGLFTELRELVNDKKFEPCSSIICFNKIPRSIEDNSLDAVFQINERYSKDNYLRSLCQAQISTFEKSCKDQGGAANYAFIRQSLAFANASNLTGRIEITLPDKGDITAENELLPKYLPGVEVKRTEVRRIDSAD